MYEIDESNELQQLEMKAVSEMYNAWDDDNKAQIGKYAEKFYRYFDNKQNRFYSKMEINH